MLIVMHHASSLFTEINISAIINGIKTPEYSPGTVGIFINLIGGCHNIISRENRHQ